MGLGLTEKRFWSLTPREFTALQKEWLNHRRHLDMRFAEVQLTMHRAWLQKGDFKLEQFLPGEPRQKAESTDWRRQKMTLNAIFEGYKKNKGGLIRGR